MISARDDQTCVDCGAACSRPGVARCRTCYLERVQAGAVLARVERTPRTCVDCGTAIGINATRCVPCAAVQAEGRKLSEDCLGRMRAAAQRRQAPARERRARAVELRAAGMRSPDIAMLLGVNVSRVREYLRVAGVTRQRKQALG